MQIKARDLKVFQSFLGAQTLGYMVASMFTNVNYSQLLIILSFYDDTQSWFILMACVAAMQVIVPWITMRHKIRFWCNFASCLAWGALSLVQTMNDFFTPLIPLSILFIAAHIFIAIRLCNLKKAQALK